LFAVWMHARVTAKARSAMTNAPITSIQGLSGVRRGFLAPGAAWIADRCKTGRS
jgi:hypothetical protein